MTRNLFLFTILVVVIAAVAGCGGGGGGGSSDPTPTGEFVVTGTVRDYSNNAPIPGATVKIGNYQATTNSSGQFTIRMTSTPIITTYSVNGGNNYHNTWAMVNGHIYNNSLSLPLPLIVKGQNSFGTIYLLNYDVPPPPPM